MKTRFPRKRYTTILISCLKKKTRFYTTKAVPNRFFNNILATLKYLCQTKLMINCDDKLCFDCKEKEKEK